MKSIFIRRNVCLLILCSIWGGNAVFANTEQQTNIPQNSNIFQNDLVSINPNETISISQSQNEKLILPNLIDELDPQKTEQSNNNKQETIEKNSSNNLDQTIDSTADIKEQALETITEIDNSSDQNFQNTESKNLNIKTEAKNKQSKEDLKPALETLLFSDLDLDSYIYVKDIVNKNYMKQLISPNQMYQTVISKKTIYLNVDMGFNSYTFEGFTDIPENPKYGKLVRDSSRFVYKLEDLSSLNLYGNVSPLLDSFTLAKTEIDEHLRSIRTMMEVDIYFSPDPLSIKQWYLVNHGLDTYEVNSIKYSTGLFPRRGYLVEGKPSLDLNVLPVWKKNITGQNTEVVVLDTGVDSNNPDLRNRLNMNKARELGGYLYPIEFSADNSHGTRVAGIIGAEAGNFIGIRGIASDTKMIPMIPNYQDTFALNYSVPYYIEPEKNQIFSESLGPDQGMIDNFMVSTDPDDVRNVKKYLDKNIVFNQSIGNYYGSWYREYYPTDRKISLFYTACRFYNIGCMYATTSALGIYPLINGIAACDSNGHHSYYSNSSSAVLVTGFGGTRNDINEGLQNFSRGIMTTDVSGIRNGTTGKYCSLLPDESFLRAFCDGSFSENTNGDFTSEMNGTSAATPMISGVVALIKSANPKLTWADIRDILIKTSSHDPLVNYMAVNDRHNIWFEDGANLIIENETITNGAGFRFSNLFGFGLVNAQKAVELAQKYRAGKLSSINKKFMNPVSLEVPEIEFRAGDTVSEGMTSTTVRAEKELKISSVILEISPKLFDTLADGDDRCDSLYLVYDDGSYFKNNYMSNSCRVSDLTFSQIEIISPSGTKSILKGLGTIVTHVADLSHPWELVTNAFYGENAKGEWQIRIITSMGERTTRLKSLDENIVVTKNRSATSIIKVPAKLKLFPRVSGEM